MIMPDATDSYYRAPNIQTPSNCASSETGHLVTLAWTTSMSMSEIDTIKWGKPNVQINVERPAVIVILQSFLSGQVHDHCSREGHPAP